MEYISKKKEKKKTDWKKELLVERSCCLEFIGQDMKELAKIGTFLKANPKQNKIRLRNSIFNKGLCNNYLEGGGGSKMSKAGLEVKLSLSCSNCEITSDHPPSSHPA